MDPDWKDVDTVAIDHFGCVRITARSDGVEVEERIPKGMYANHDGHYITTIPWDLFIEECPIEVLLETLENLHRKYSGMVKK